MNVVDRLVELKKPWSTDGPFSGDDAEHLSAKGLEQPSYKGGEENDLEVNAKRPDDLRLDVSELQRFIMEEEATLVNEYGSANLVRARFIMKYIFNPETSINWETAAKSDKVHSPVFSQKDGHFVTPKAVRNLIEMTTNSKAMIAQSMSALENDLVDRIRNIRGAAEDFILISLPKILDADEPSIDFDGMRKLLLSWLVAPVAPLFRNDTDSILEDMLLNYIDKINEESSNSHSWLSFWKGLRIKDNQIVTSSQNLWKHQQTVEKLSPGSPGAMEDVIHRIKILSNDLENLYSTSISEFRFHIDSEWAPFSSIFTCIARMNTAINDIIRSDDTLFSRYEQNSAHELLPFPKFREIYEAEITKYRVNAQHPKAASQISKEGLLNIITKYTHNIAFAHNSYFENVFNWMADNICLIVYDSMNEMENLIYYHYPSHGSISPDIINTFKKITSSFVKFKDEMSSVSEPMLENFNCRVHNLNYDFKSLNDTVAEKIKFLNNLPPDITNVKKYVMKDHKKSMKSLKTAFKRVITSTNFLEFQYDLLLTFYDNLLRSELSVLIGFIRTVCLLNLHGPLVNKCHETVLSMYDNINIGFHVLSDIIIGRMVTSRDSLPPDIALYAVADELQPNTSNTHESYDTPPQGKKISFATLITEPAPAPNPGIPKKAPQSVEEFGVSETVDKVNVLNGLVFSKIIDERKDNTPGEKVATDDILGDPPSESISSLDSPEIEHSEICTVDLAERAPIIAVPNPNTASQSTTNLVVNAVNPAPAIEELTDSLGVRHDGSVEIASICTNLEDHVTVQQEDHVTVQQEDPATEASDSLINSQPVPGHDQSSRVSENYSMDRFTPEDTNYIKGSPSSDCPDNTIIIKIIVPSPDKVVNGDIERVGPTMDLDKCISNIIQSQSNSDNSSQIDKKQITVSCDSLPVSPNLKPPADPLRKIIATPCSRCTDYDRLLLRNEIMSNKIRELTEKVIDLETTIVQNKSNLRV